MYEWRKLIQNVVDEINRCIQARDDEALILGALSERLGYSEFYTMREFSEIAGMPLRLRAGMPHGGGEDRNCYERL